MTNMNVNNSDCFEANVIVFSAFLFDFIMISKFQLYSQFKAHGSWSQNNKIIIFSWSCDPFLQDHQNKWSHGYDYDLVFFMISWFWSWRFHDLLPQNPWSGDPTHGNSMIRWSHSPNFHDLVISPSEIQPLDPVISPAKTKIPWSGDLCIYFL